MSTNSAASNVSMASPFLRRFWAVLLALLLSAGSQLSARDSGKPLVVDDRGANWSESSAWGGGARVSLNLHSHLNPGRSLDFLAGAKPNIIIGCSSKTPEKAHWRVDLVVWGAGAAIRTPGEAERAYTIGVDHMLGAPGELILVDELDKDYRRIPMRISMTGLETAPLDAAAFRALLDASELRIETPRLLIRSGTRELGLIYARIRSSGSPCGPIPHNAN